MSTPKRRAIHTPTIAAVFCTRDRPEALLESLDSIWRQTRLPDELIIIDDGQMPDAVLRRIAGRCRSLGVAFQWERNPSPGLTRARNRAAAVATSEVLFYLDDDVTCNADVISRLAELLADALVAGVTASIIEPVFSTLPARLYQAGYRLAGWWCVSPRRRPPGPRPKVLRRPDIAVPARWLSGAAMALRRDVVRANPFDERLSDYALGEDREMGYRLAPKHWLLQARQAGVVHRRDVSGRPDSRRLGFMTGYNYVYILRKTCSPGPGQWAIALWSLCVIATMHLLWSLVGDRSVHWGELLGLLEGVRRLFSNFAVGEIGKTGPRSTHAIGPSNTTTARAVPRAQSHPLPPRQRTRSTGGSCRASDAAPHDPHRALFITNRLECGGAERMLIGLVNHLPGHRVRPHVLCLKDAGPLAPECHRVGVPVFEGLLRFKTDAAVITRIRRIISEHAIDSVTIAHSGGDRMFWGTLAAGLSALPVVVWSHWFPTAGHRHFERPNRALYRCVDAFVALGERHRRALVRHEHLPAGRIAVIPNAVDLAAFMHATPRKEARRRLRLDVSQVGVAIIANLRREKRHDVFIEAAHRLAPANPRLRFFIIGDGPCRDAVQAAAAASGLDHETLRLLGPRDDVPVLLSGLDISCLCSEVECFSVSMLEAAAAGCAFIGPAVGCMPEYLKHRQTGFLIEAGSPGALADAIGELADNAALRQAMAREAKKKAIQRFGFERLAGEFADLLQSLGHRRRLAHRRARRADVLVEQPAGDAAPLFQA